MSMQTISNTPSKTSGNQLSHRGFTLIEFMIVVAILAILLATAVPGFSYWQAKNEATFVTDLLYRQLQGSREHAINLNQRVSLCGVNANNECSASNFSTLKMFIDDDNDKVVDADETVLAESPVRTPRGTLTLNAHNSLSFKADGSSNGTPASFIYCPNNAAHAQLRQKVTLSLPGRVYVAEADAADCP